MVDYRHMIVEDVQRSIMAVNNIVASLERDAPLSSDIIQINYPQATVDEFLRHSQTVVDSMLSASNRARTWLGDTGYRLCQNLDEARRVEDGARETSSQVREAEVRVRTTEINIHTSEYNVSHAQDSLESAQSALEDARRTRERMVQEHIAVHAGIHLGAMILSTFVPPLGLAAAAINIAVMPQTVDNEVVRARNRELDAARAHLDSQRDVLARERAECARLISKVAELRTRGKQLAAEARTLRAAQRPLAELSTRISTRSATIATIRSMRNVVAGIRGVVDGLRRVEMFVGPLALLNDAAFGVLDRRVAAIRRSRLTV
ncbi:hypothetical protein BD311DRAFT_799899 [Dichomitus squalens]|uniref:Uncharacterized protein n=1 Tax=Dichomitus squalens TaxID=114155 RepID=A0A4V2JZ42_9APHY|nr:hypothetical protein BD311DRAFT_799899 [Dichomitus squalens]